MFQKSFILCFSFFLLGACVSAPKDPPLSAVPIQKVQYSTTRFFDDRVVLDTESGPEPVVLNSYKDVIESVSGESARKQMTEVKSQDLKPKKAFWIGLVAMGLTGVFENTRKITARTISTAAWGVSWSIWLGGASLSAGLLEDMSRYYNKRLGFNVGELEKYSDPDPPLGVSYSFKRF